MTAWKRSSGVIHRRVGGSVLARATATAPSAAAVGVVRVVNGNFVQTFRLGAPGAGFAWKAKARRGPVVDQPQIVFGEGVTEAEFDVILGPSGIERGPVILYTAAAATVVTSARRFSSLTWPSGAGEDPPRLVGVIDDIQADVGDPEIVVPLSGLFVSESSLAVRLDTGAIPGEWTFDAAEQTLTIPTDDPVSANVIVDATNPGGTTSTGFSVLINAAALAFVTPLPTFTGANSEPGTPWALTGAVTATGGNGTPVVEYRVLRNGARLTVFSATLPTYTLQPTDVGATINVQVRISDDDTLPDFTNAPSTILPGSAVVENPAATAPTIVGNIQDYVATIGAAVTRTANGVFAGTGTLTYSGDVDGVAMPVDGFAINATSGALTIPTGAAYAERVIRVYASNGTISQPVEFTGSVTAGLGVVTTPSISSTGTNIGAQISVGGGFYGGGTGPYDLFWQFFRNGVALGDFGGAQSITSTAAGVYTAIVRVRDKSTPVQSIDVPVNGSVTIQADAPTQPADYTVSTQAQLETALNDALPRTGALTIFIQAGAVISANMNRAMRKTGQRLTITTSRTNPGIFRHPGNNGFQWVITNCENITFDGLEFENPWKDGVNANNSASENSIYGGAAGYPDESKRGLNFNGVNRNITWRNCRFTGYHEGVNVHRSENMTIEWNECRRYGMDVWNLYGANNTAGGAQNIHRNLQILSNLFHQPDIDARRAPQTTPTNRHPDVLALQGSQYRDVSIINNAFEGPNGYQQLIFFTNTGARNITPRTIASHAPWRHVGGTIRGNVGVSRHSGQLFFEDIEDFVIEDNKFYTLNTAPDAPWDDVKDKPKLNLLGQCVNVTIRRNVTGPISYDNSGNSPNPSTAGMFTFGAGADANTFVTQTTPKTFAEIPKPPCGRWGYEGGTTLTPPTLNAIPNQTIPFGGSGTLNLNDFAAGPGPITFTITTSPTANDARIVLGTNGNLTMSGASGTVTVTVVASNGVAPNATRTFQALFQAAPTGQTPIWEPGVNGAETYAQWAQSGIKDGGQVELIGTGNGTGIKVTFPAAGAGAGYQRNFDIPLITTGFLVYRIKMRAGFNAGSGKLPGLAGGPNQEAGQGGGDYGSFSLRPSFRADKSGNNYFYWAEQPFPAGGYGNQTVFGAPLTSNSLWTNMPGPGNEWISGQVQTIGIYYQLNTPGQANGLTRSYLDGVMVNETSGFRFVGPAPAGSGKIDNGNRFLDRLRMSTFPNNAHAVDEWIEFTGFKLYSAPTPGFV